MHRIEARPLDSAVEHAPGMNIDGTLRMSCEAEPDRNAGSRGEMASARLALPAGSHRRREPVCGESANAGLSYPRRVDIIFRIGYWRRFPVPKRQQAMTAAVHLTLLIDLDSRGIS